MDNNELNKIMIDIRKEYQIPPFFDDIGLKNFIQEGEAFLLGLNPGCNLSNDMTYRMLLKTYVYYSYHHNINEWHQNYAAMILNWQLTREADL